ncbi:T9SS type A sorting domain-containing protein, partial [Fulvivirga sp. RKSG066]|uniref:T9SS type A sorting domain-containing protein n=1 Tax=Fulvivirga aurantia TaxID=2529383 RepID=UPI0012BBCCBD
VIILSFVSICSFAQKIESSGNWGSSNIWEDNDIAGPGDDVDLLEDLSVTIRSGETFTVSKLTVKKNSTLTIETGGTLIVTGEFKLEDNTNIVADGNLEIQGDLILEKDVQANIAGAVQVDGDFTAKEGSDLVIDGSLNVDGDVDFEKDVTVTGDGVFTYNGSCSDVDGTCNSVGPLPVDLLYLSGEVKNKSVVITWATSTEINNDYFLLERSVDGVNYEKVKTIEGAGNSSSTLKYEVIDDNPLFGQSYYRLTQVDFDGAYEVFNPVAVYVSSLSEMAVYPNPAVKGTDLKVFSGAQENVKFAIYNTEGVAIVSQMLQSGQNIIALSEDIKSGFYIVKMTSGDDQIVKRLIIK